jgi:hypothetical protein
VVIDNPTHAACQQARHSRHPYLSPPLIIAEISFRQESVMAGSVNKVILVGAEHGIIGRPA